MVYSAVSRVLLALSLVPTLLASYDCSQLAPKIHQCPPELPGEGPGPRYPNCLVKKFSVSAFIECADLGGPDAPKFSVTEDGNQQSLGVVDLLKRALSFLPDCSDCPMVDNIQRAAEQSRTLPFTKAFCNLNPSDQGICCLRNCIHGVLQEHSIQAFCNGDVKDIMSADLVPDRCKSNVETGDGSSDSASSDSGSSESSSTSDDYSTADSQSVDVINSTPSRIAYSESTSSPAANNPVAADTTSTPPASQPTTNAGADSRRGARYCDRVKRLGLAILPIIAVF